MNSRDLIKELENAGWVLDRVKGSHHIYKNPKTNQIVPIPHPKKDLGKGIVNKIRKQTGLQ